MEPHDPGRVLISTNKISEVREAGRSEFKHVPVRPASDRPGGLVALAGPLAVPSSVEGAVRRRPHKRAQAPAGTCGPVSPTATTRYAEVRTVTTDRLCHQSGWSGTRLQVVERAIRTLLVGENSSKPLES